MNHKADYNRRHYLQRTRPAEAPDTRNRDQIHNDLAKQIDDFFRKGGQVEVIPAGQPGGEGSAGDE